MGDELDLFGKAWAIGIVGNKNSKGYHCVWFYDSRTGEHRPRCLEIPERDLVLAKLRPQFPDDVKKTYREELTGVDSESVSFLMELLCETYLKIDADQNLDLHQFFGEI